MQETNVKSANLNMDVKAGKPTSDQSYPVQFMMRQQKSPNYNMAVKSYEAAVSTSILEAAA
jgi:hypothetical protein